MADSVLPLNRWYEIVPEDQYARPTLKLVDPGGNTTTHNSFRKTAKQVIHWINSNPDKISVTADVSSLYRVNQATFAGNAPQYYDSVEIPRLNVHIETKQNREVLIAGILKLLEICGISRDAFQVGIVEENMDDGYLSIEKWNDFNPYSRDGSFKTKLKTPDGDVTRHTSGLSSAVRHIIAWLDTNHSHVPQDKIISVVKPETGKIREFGRDIAYNSNGKPFRSPLHAENLGICFEMDQNRSVLILGMLELIQRCGLQLDTFRICMIDGKDVPDLANDRIPPKPDTRVVHWTALNRREIKDKLLEFQKSGDKIACPGCGRRVEKEFCQIDHLNPRKSGGYDYITNRILLCSHCNQAKSAHLTLSGLQKRNVETGWMENRKRADRIQKTVTEKVRDFVENTKL